MREISLREYQPKEERLSEGELSALTQAKKDLGLSITPSGHDAYALRPSSIVGAVEVGGLSVIIEPKVGVGQLISLACYAMGRKRDDLVKFGSDFAYAEETALPEFLARAFADAAEKAFARGLLRGYVAREEALQTIRGRIRFDDQIRRRFGLPLPVEVRYDEFTDDILSNRLVKAANRLLRRAGPLSPGTRRRLGRIDALLDGVSLCGYPRNAVPEVKFDRLNAHYEAVVALARLVLRYGAHEAERGDVRASGFTMDMNAVFQEFVTAALREKLAPYGGKLRSDKGLPSAYLDEERRVALYPDLVWQEGGRCVFVGDAKYKRIPNREHGDRADRASNAERASNADLYQILAYATALDLPGGMLIYAEGEANEATYTVRHAGKRLQVVALDLSGTLDEILARVGAIAEDARALRNAAVGARQRAA